MTRGRICIYMKQNLLSFSEIPSDFQKELFEKIAAIIKKGESVQLYGVSGSGNSLVARSLIQSNEIKKKYFVGGYSFILFDANLLLERTVVGLYRFFLTLFPSNSDLISDPAFIQNKIDEKITGFCERGKLILIIDHMNELCLPELKPFFVNLYGIYRKMEPNLNFIFMFSNTIKDSDLENFGPIKRLIVQNVIKNNGFCKKDGLWFIGEKEKQARIRLTDEEKEKLYELSGGFPRTLKRLVESVGRGLELDKLQSDPAIDPLLVIHLEELLQNKDDLQRIPVLESLVKSKENADRGESLTGLKLIEKLTRNEEILLKLFLKNQGNIVKRADGIEHLWGESAMEVSDHAYDQIVLRLRKKLKGSYPSAGIETVRGRGHVLKIT